MKFNFGLFGKQVRLSNSILIWLFVLRLMSVISVKDVKTWFFTCEQTLIYFIIV